MQKNKLDLRGPVLFKIGGSVLAHRDKTEHVANQISEYESPVVCFGTGPLDAAWQFELEKSKHFQSRSVYIEILNHLQGINCAQFSNYLLESGKKLTKVTSVASLPTEGTIGLIQADAFSRVLNGTRYLGGDVRAIRYASALGLEIVVKVSNSPSFLDGFEAGRISAGKYTISDDQVRGWEFVDKGCLATLAELKKKLIILPFSELGNLCSGKTASFVYIDGKSKS